MKTIVYFKKEHDLQTIKECGLIQNKDPEFVCKTIHGYAYRLYIQCEDLQKTPIIFPDAVKIITEMKHETPEMYVKRVIRKNAEMKRNAENRRESLKKKQEEQHFARMYAQFLKREKKRRRKINEPINIEKYAKMS